ncbi:MAG: hypothetical protein P8Q57_04750 [Yoonia sp.]|jgi:hypothetical protein|nr:hypothetical protein [Yoonia sp.]
MRIFLTIALMLAGQSAVAHPGHLIEVAGHDHWLAGIAIGIGLVGGLWGILRGEDEDAESEEEMEEEAA